MYCITLRLSQISGAYGKDRILTKVWLTVFCCIDQWGQAVQLIIYEAKKGNHEGLCLVLSQVNRGHVKSDEKGPVLALSKGCWGIS